MSKLYIQHEGKVVDTDDKYKLVMAITLDPRTDYKNGVIRCITNRSGTIGQKGNIDRSELHLIKGDSLERFEIGDKLTMKNENEILDQLIDEGMDFIGLEDPDIWIEDETGLMHLYFTIAILWSGNIKEGNISLGHAVGSDLNSLEMTAPVLLGDSILFAKELSIAPQNSKGFRFNLFESKDLDNEMRYSTVRVAIVEDMGKSWKYGEVVFHPKDHNLKWIAKDASPGPLFSKNFIDVGEGKLLGLMNGREVNQKIGNQVKHGTFSIGLFIYDYENGKIDWVSPEPLIIDSEAITITFASQFVETGKGEGILYAHVDDSFVRAYTLKAEWLKELLPK